VHTTNARRSLTDDLRQLYGEAAAACCRRQANVRVRCARLSHARPTRSTRDAPRVNHVLPSSVKQFPGPELKALVAGSQTATVPAAGDIFRAKLQR